MRWTPYRLTLRQLQYIAAVAEDRNFRRAAERCGVSQPSLSAQVAEAEESLETRFFERSRRGVLVTPAGRVVVERARRILLEAEDLLRATAGHADPMAGTLRLGVIPTIAPYFLPDIDPVLRREFPALRILWTEDKTGSLVRRVNQGDQDGAILAREADLDRLVLETIGVDPFVLAVPKGHRLARGRRAVSTRELAGERVLLLDEGHCFRNQALELCSHTKAEEMGFRATSLATLAQVTASGAGVTLLPRLSVEVENRRNQLVIRPFIRPAPHRTIVLAMRPGAVMAESLDRIAAVARAAYAHASR
jgi:LysR family hydrogen peroxide-inducible transcriptional activator